MIDLLLLNTVLNIVWYAFTSLFLLYKFTSFFSYMYNFAKFSGKVLSGGAYICSRLYMRIRYPSTTEPLLNESSRNSIFSKVKSFFGFKNHTENNTENIQEEVLPLYETQSSLENQWNRRQSSNFMHSSRYSDLQPQQNINSASSGHISEAVFGDYKYTSLSNSPVEPKLNSFPQWESSSILPFANMHEDSNSAVWQSETEPSSVYFNT